MLTKLIPEPGHLNLKLTDDCNMKCSMCGQVYSEQRKQNNSLDFARIKQLIEETPSINSAYLFGGEPFMYRDLEPLMKFFTEHDVAMDMTTNGLLLDKYIDTIFDYNINSITISIDTLDPKKFSKIRGLDCFDIVLNNIKKLLQKKESLNLPRRPYINVNCVLVKDNLYELDEYYNFFYNEFPSLTAINFENQIVMSKSLGNDYEKLMKDYFQSESGSWKWFYNKIAPFTDEEMEYLYQKLQELKKKDKVTFLAPLEHERFKYSLSEEYMYGKKVCFKPFQLLSILPNGDVTFCVDFPDYILGNIYESTISEIWNTERAKKFQEYMLNGNIPICARCPHSY